MIPHRRCPGCGKLVAAMIQVCPTCGTERPEDQPEPGEITGADLKRGCLYVLAFLVAVGVLGSILDEMDPNSGRERDADEQRVDFALACEDAVEALLVQPHTADFPWAMSTDVRLLGNGSGALRSHVEAMNLMGATIRRTFTCYGDRAADGRWEVGAALDPLTP